MKLDFNKAIVMKVVNYSMVVMIAIFSAICTYNLTINAFHSEIIAYMLTIIIEGCLTIFSYKFHKQSKGYILMWVAYLAVSIIASQGAIINDTIAKVSDKIHTSQEYVKYNNEIVNIDSQIATYQEKLKGSKSLEIKSSSLIDSLNTQLTERRAELSKIRETPKTEAERQRKIKEIEGIKNQIEQEKESIIGTKLGFMQSVEVEKGYKDAIEKLNNKKNEARLQLDKDLEKYGNGVSPFKSSLNGMGLTEIEFWTAFFILLEITRFLLLNDNNKLLKAFSSTPNNSTSTKNWKERLKDWSNPVTKSISTSKSTPQTITAKNNNAEISMESKVNRYSIKKKGLDKPKPKIGFTINNTPLVHVDENHQVCIESKVEQNGYTEKDVENYLEIMHKTKYPAGHSRGFKWIGSKIGIDAKTAEKIKGHLETIGVVKSTGSRTIILKGGADV